MLYLQMDRPDTKEDRHTIFIIKYGDNKISPATDRQSKAEKI